jgi:peptide/nickel transport system permease protein
MSTLSLSAPAPLRRVLGEPRVVIGAGLLLLLIALAVFAPWLAPHGPNEQDLLSTLLPPAWARAATGPFRWAPTRSASACCRG